MKTLLYSILFSLLPLAMAHAQVDDAYVGIQNSHNASNAGRATFWSADYVITVPTGDQAGFISLPSYRGFSVAGGGFITDQLLVGGSIGWTGSYAEYGRRTYELEGIAGAITGRRYDYLYALPVLATVHYFFLPDASVEPFVGLGLGAQYTNLETQIGSLSVSDNAWDFSLNPEAGIYIPMGLGATWGFTAKVRYNQVFYKERDFSNLQNWGFHIGVGFLY